MECKPFSDYWVLSIIWQSFYLTYQKLLSEPLRRLTDKGATTTTTTTIFISHQQVK
jgi:hypothetical protein